MTALLAADEAARLVPGEQLVIVRAGDRIPITTGGPPYGFNPNDTFVAPQDWVALGPCPNCDGSGWVRVPGLSKRWPCPDCRDGRQIVPLYTECPSCHGNATSACGGRHPYRDGRVLVGRGDIEVVPEPDEHGNYRIVVDCVEVVS